MFKLPGTSPNCKVALHFKMLEAVFMGKESSRTEGCLFMMPEKGAVAPYSIVYSENCGSLTVFLAFCLLPRHIYDFLLQFKRAISFLHLEIILLVVSKYGCSHF